MKKSCENMAIRERNAAQTMCESIAYFGEISADDAVKVFNLFLSRKLMKYDGMAYKVKHGAYLDQSYIMACLAEIKPVFRLFMTNHDYYLEREFTDLAEAIKHAKSTTFDVRIDKGTDMVCSVSYFGGVRIISEAYRKEISDITAKL